MRYIMYRKLRDMEKEQGIETNRGMHRRVAFFVRNAATPDIVNRKINYRSAL
jgi:hypothetical protein